MDRPERQSRIGIVFERRPYTFAYSVLLLVSSRSSHRVH